MIFFGSYEDFIQAAKDGNVEEYLNSLIRKSDPAIMYRQAVSLQNKMNNIIEYLYWKGENVYTFRYDIRPMLFIVFPDGIKSKRIYEKLFNSNLIDKKQNESIEILVYPRHEKLFDILSTILLSH